MQVTVVQSYRFPNNWSVQPLKLERDGETDITRIFTDRLDPSGSFAVGNAIKWCEENGMEIVSYQVQWQNERVPYGFADNVEKIVLNRGKTEYYNGKPVA